jgi:hypothetical protein
MELYIEKEFLDNFYLEFDESSASRSQKIVATILKEYAEVECFIDCEIETLEQLEFLKSENSFFKAICDKSKSPLGVKSIKDHFFDKSKCEQTLIFTQNNKDWFNEAERKGALCFSYENYQQRIENIVQQCHFKIDLSEGFQGWEQTLQNIQELMPLNKIIINDAYLLDKPEFYESNVYPLIKAISKNKKTKKLFYTDILNKKFPFKTDIIYNLLKEKYPTSEIKIAHNNVDDLKSHDRLLYSNHYIIDCAIGFNFNQHLTSNSQIIIETIFEKYTYNRLRNHLRKMENHFQNLITDKRLNAYYPN